MSSSTALVVGVVLGAAAAALLINPTSCCRRVAGAVTEELQDSPLGKTWGGIVGAVLAPFSPSLLDLFGVKP